MQQRRIETRARLKRAATELIAASSYEALRVEQVVARAKVAKGTFFSHFRDKDSLLAELIGGDLNHALDAAEAGPPPETITGINRAIAPILTVMTRERLAFDIVVRFSGAAAIEEQSEVSHHFIRQIEVLSRWIAPLQGCGIREDHPPEFLADGVQAFMVQAVALTFCLAHAPDGLDDRMLRYLEAWLAPGR